MMATLSAAIFNPTSGLAEPNFNDTLGFAFDVSNGLSGSAMTYSIDFSWFDLEFPMNALRTQPLSLIIKHLIPMKLWLNITSRSNMIQSAARNTTSRFSTIFATISEPTTATST